MPKDHGMKTASALLNKTEARSPGIQHKHLPNYALGQIQLTSGRPECAKLLTAVFLPLWCAGGHGIIGFGVKLTWQAAPLQAKVSTSTSLSTEDGLKHLLNHAPGEHPCPPGRPEATLSFLAESPNLSCES